MKLKTFDKVFRSWLPIAVVATLISGLVYAATQQNYRQSANDPQIQIAEDTAAQYDSILSSDGAPVAIPSSEQLDKLTRESVDPTKSLATFVNIYENSGELLSTSSILGGVSKTFELPKGLFDQTRQHKRYVVTWQPRADVRIATVIVKAKHGYVLAGRNLREVESRERRLIHVVGAAWAVMMVTSYGLIALI